MKWDHSLSIGIMEIDAQHQNLVDITNQVEALFKKALEGNGDYKETCKVIETLSAYADKHFKTEEALFDKIGYPNREAHEEKHREFEAYIKGMTLDRIESSEETVLIQVFAFLSNWIVDHIKTEDFEYKKFINQQ